MFFNFGCGNIGFGFADIGFGFANIGIGFTDIGIGFVQYWVWNPIFPFLTLVIGTNNQNQCPIILTLTLVSQPKVKTNVLGTNVGYF